MNIDQIYSQILSQTYTLLELQRRLRILRTDCLNRLFSGSAPLETSYRDQQWVKSLGEGFLTQFKQDNVYKIFDLLQAKADKNPILVIYIPFEMPPQEADRLGVFLRQNYGNISLFDVKFDPYLIAGASLVWRGVYKDYSLRRRIEDRKEEILVSFKGIIK